MNNRHNALPAALEPRRLKKILVNYQNPSHARSITELAITALPLVGLWVAAWQLYAHGFWWATLMIGAVAAGFLVRLFLIQHDCSHGSFFPHKRLNDWIGRFLGVFTLTPYDLWRRTHAIHHATSGNLDRRGIGDVDTLTLKEYSARSRLGRLKYRIYRNPLVMFGLGPAYLFLVQHRLPFGLMRGGLQPWLSTMATNGGILLLVGGLIWLVGIQAFLVVHAPIMLLAASIGVWLFYVQHQFEETTWSKNERWSVHEAALHGSSHYDLPWILRWFTANIGIHHIHHLSSRIPYYRLPQVLRDYPELAGVGRLTLLQSFGCVRLALWDEDQQRLISFRDARRAAA